MAVNEPADIEAGALEVAAQPDLARIDEVDDGRDDLGLAGGVLGDGLHQIEQGHVLRHGPFPPWWIGRGCCRPHRVLSFRTPAFTIALTIPPHRGGRPSERSSIRSAN